MKILKIEIENFGKFSNFVYEFKEDLTVIDEKNGFGKTTIAEFINAMIYGMPRATASQTANNNLRYRYAPWQGGIYGGSLVFKFANKEYKITRSFGASSASFDTFELYNNLTNVKTTTFNGKVVDKANFGDVLLKINQVTYQRTNFVPENSVMYYEEINELDQDLNSRLRVLLGDTSDDNNLQKATAVLNKNIRALSTQRNSRYSLNQEEISKTIISMEEAQNAERLVTIDEVKLKELEEEKEEKEKKIKEFNKNIELLTKEEANRLKLQNHNENLKLEKEINEKLTEIKKVFLRKTVEETDLSKLKEKLDNLKQVKNDFNDYKEDKEKKINNLRDLEKLQRDDNTSIILEFKLTQEIDEKDKEKLKKEELSSLVKPFKALDIILSIITLGIYFLIVFLKNKNLKKQIETINRKLININNNIDETKKKLKEHRSIDKKDYNKEIEELYKLINEKKETYHKLKAETEKLYANYMTKADSLDVAYHVIETSYNEHFLLTKRLKEVKRAIKDFVEPLKITIDESLNLSDLKIQEQTLRIQIENLVKEITTLERTISDNSDIASNFDQLEALLNDLEAKKIYYEEQKELLEKTVNYLTSANQQLASKYLEPLQDEVNKLIKDFSLKDLTVQFDGNSMMSVKPEGSNNYYDLGHYSSGNKDFISVLVRFSLINIIYEDIDPFIILDDSFLHFDDDNIKLVKPLLKRLSKKNQIIYFTCSSSRNLS